jgi:hypothetical protein
MGLTVLTVGSSSETPLSRHTTTLCQISDYNRTAVLLGCLRMSVGREVEASVRLKTRNNASRQMGKVMKNGRNFYFRFKSDATNDHYVCKATTLCTRISFVSAFY